MKNNKGFTLVEILSVVVLLGAISLIAIPTIKNMIKDSKQKLYNEQINLIKDGLKNWGSANVMLLPEDNKSIKLTLGQLKQEYQAIQKKYDENQEKIDARKSDKSCGEVACLFYDFCFVQICNI